MKLEGLDIDQTRNLISDLYNQISDTNHRKEGKEYLAITTTCYIRSIFLSNKLSVPPVIEATVKMQKIEPIELSEKESSGYQFALKIILKMKPELSDYKFLLPENWKDKTQDKVQTSFEWVH